MVNADFLNDLLDKYDEYIVRARADGIIPHQKENPALYKKSIDRINNYMLDYADQNYKIVYGENERKAYTDYLSEMANNEPEWLKEKPITKKPNNVDKTTFKEDSGSFYDYDPDKKTVKAKLYRGAAEGNQTNAVSYWTTDKKYAEEYAKKAGETGKVYSTVVELPVYEANGDVYFKTNGIYSEGTTAEMSEKYGKKGSKLVAASNQIGAADSVALSVPFGSEANDELTRRYFMLGEDYIKENIQVVKPSPPANENNNSKPTISQANTGKPKEKHHQKNESKNLTPEQQMTKLKDELVSTVKGINSNSTPEEIKKAQSVVESIEKKISSVEAEIKKVATPTKVLTSEELTATAKQLEAAIDGNGPLLLDAPKSYKAKEKLKKAAEGQPSGPKILLPHKENSLNKNLSNIEGKSSPIKTNEQIKNYIQKNRWKGAGIGLGVGVVKSIFDSEDDDVITSTTKAVKASASVIGASYLAELGLDYASSKNYQVANMWAPTTVQDYVKGEVVGAAEKIKDTVDAERKMVSFGGKFGATLKAGAAIVGVASILDIGQKVADNREAKRMQHEQEKALIQKEKRRKEKNKENSYGYINDGEILFDLFGERTGHYKMGNSKFM